MTSPHYRDLHDDDTGLRDRFHQQLVDLRRAAGFTQAELGKLLDRKASAVGEFERRRNPLLVNAQRYPHVYGLKLVLEPVGLPEPAADDPTPGILAAKIIAAPTPEQRWAAERRWLMATLRAIREGAGITQRALAKTTGTAQSAVPYIDDAPPGMLLWSAQRYARAIGITLGTGGHLDIRIEAAT